MSKSAQPISESEKIRFRLHPRVFAALGSELVTSDIVAIIELVKNSYDADATRVDVRLIRNNRSGKLSIEIEDDGHGMTRSVIENVWCVVATPYRLKASFSESGKKGRRVSGEKGLGRLSAARLGGRLELITRGKNELCWQVNLKWADLAGANTLDSCDVDIIKSSYDGFSDHTGTLVRITDLKTEWDDDKQADLREQLSRLVSPFDEIDGFTIWVTLPDEEAEPLEIKAPDFLSSPPYLLKGHVDGHGFLRCNYRLSSQQNSRTLSIKRELWATEEATGRDGKKKKTQCGPFDFEIRAWDIDGDSVQDLAQRFHLNKSSIRKDIKSYQGLSLYRDGILVLPKSDSARDWLGLDLRRVSKTGTRLSTNQIVGHVAITAEGNSEIKDTSDRERLEDNQASRAFKKLLQDTVKILEDERSKDRQESKKEKPFKDLFISLSMTPLIERMTRALKEGADSEQLIPLLEEHGADVEKTIGQIEQRLYYYNRLASLGTLAAMLVHEVRHHTMVIGKLTRGVTELIKTEDSDIKDIEQELRLAEQSVRSLERLADRFAPLANTLCANIP
jgi:histidine kinase/DNA gyrase B/HSP90-like ATPase